MRIYTIIDCDGNAHQYGGFNKDFTTPHVLVLTQSEDVVIPWAVDSRAHNDHVLSLVLYLEDHQPEDKIIGIYEQAWRREENAKS